MNTLITLTITLSDILKDNLIWRQHIPIKEDLFKKALRKATKNKYLYLVIYFPLS